MRSLKESLDKLYALRSFGIKPGLEPVKALLAGLGNPQHGFAAIHVAGTNGKGSVCVMLASVLHAAGFRVGLYTSPHLVRFNERIQINGCAVTDGELADLFDLVEPVAKSVQGSGSPATFFEFTTVMAFEYFRRQKVQLAVVETGMGGRLDATNVVLPLASVITRIGLDHMAYLGDTIEAIAGEKAGIIKEGRPVICGAMPEEARGVIARVAAERHAAFVDGEQAVAVRRVSQSLTGQKVGVGSAARDYGTVAMSLLGRHQLENIATAVATIETVVTAGGLRVSAEAVTQGLRQAKWPGRLQVLEADPPMILDGAHNPDAARVLSAALKELLRKRPVALVWGMCSDKDALGFSAELGGVIRACWPVRLKTDRTRAPEELARIGQSRGWEAMQAGGLGEAIEAARGWARERGGAVCIAGSLYLAGEVLAMREGTQATPI